MREPIEVRLYRAMEQVAATSPDLRTRRFAEAALEDARHAPTPDDDPGFYTSMRAMLGSHQRSDEEIANAWFRATTKDGPVPKSSTLIHELLKDEVPA